jgi:hypothetical protein
VPVLAGKAARSGLGLAPIIRALSTTPDGR